MDYQHIFFSSYEIVLSLLFGLLTIFLSMKVLTLTFFKTENSDLLGGSNLAASLFGGTLILSVLLLVHVCITPSVDTLRALVFAAESITPQTVGLAFGYFAIFYSVTLAISMTVIFLTMQIYMVATIHVDEIAELKRGNVAISVTMSVVVLGMSLFVREPVQRFIGSLVDYDNLPIAQQTIETEPVIPTTAPQDDLEIPSQGLLPESPDQAPHNTTP